MFQVPYFINLCFWKYRQKLKINDFSKKALKTLKHTFCVDNLLFTSGVQKKDESDIPSNCRKFKHSKANSFTWNDDLQFKFRLIFPQKLQKHLYCTRSVH